MLTDGACDGEAVYRAVTAQSPDAKVIVPPRSSAVARDTNASIAIHPDKEAPVEQLVDVLSAATSARIRAQVGVYTKQKPK